MDEKFEAVKKALRFTHNALDDDIKRNITAAESDMALVGISRSYQGAELYTQCIVFYCKWIYDFMGKGEEFRKAYERLRDSMSLDSKNGSG